MHELKPSKTDCQRPCRPTSGCTIQGDGCFTPRWFKSWLTCAASTRSTPNSTAPCPSNPSTVCSSPRWCWRCLVARSPRSCLSAVTMESESKIVSVCLSVSVCVCVLSPRHLFHYKDEGYYCRQMLREESSVTRLHIISAFYSVLSVFNSTNGCFKNQDFLCMSWTHTP